MIKAFLWLCFSTFCILFFIGLMNATIFSMNDYFYKINIGAPIQEKIEPFGYIGGDFGITLGIIEKSIFDYVETQYNKL